MLNFKKAEMLVNKLTPPQFSAWIAWWDEERAITTLENGKDLKFILPVWYRVEEGGKISAISSGSKEKILNLAKEKSIFVLPTISNGTTSGFDPKRVSILINDGVILQAEIESLVDLAKNKGFSGWDLDFEQVYEKDRQKYSEFISVFAQKLHKEGLLLSVSVHAQTGSIYDWEGSKGQDWKSIGGNVDFVRIMAYDFHSGSTGPGPITPLNWLESILEYAVEELPKEKIVLALPTYGYDWSEGGINPVQYTDAIELLNQHNQNWQRDKKSFTLEGSYEVNEDKHTLWFEDAESLVKKVEIARNYGIYQFSLWRLGGEDPKIWESF